MKFSLPGNICYRTDTQICHIFFAWFLFQYSEVLLLFADIWFSVYFVSIPKTHLDLQLVFYLIRQWLQIHQILMLHKWSIYCLPMETFGGPSWKQSLLNVMLDEWMCVCVCVCVILGCCLSWDVGCSLFVSQSLHEICSSMKHMKEISDWGTKKVFLPQLCAQHIHSECASILKTRSFTWKFVSHSDGHSSEN